MAKWATGFKVPSLNTGVLVHVYLIKNTTGGRRKIFLIRAYEANWFSSCSAPSQPPSLCPFFRVKFLYDYGFWLLFNKDYSISCTPKLVLYSTVCCLFPNSSMVLSLFHCLGVSGIIVSVTSTSRQRTEKWPGSTSVIWVLMYCWLHTLYPCSWSWL